MTCRNRRSAKAFERIIYLFIGGMGWDAPCTILVVNHRRALTLDLFAAILQLWFSWVCVSSTLVRLVVVLRTLTTRLTPATDFTYSKLTTLYY